MPRATAPGSRPDASPAGTGFTPPPAGMHSSGLLRGRTRPSARWWTEPGLDGGGVGAQLAGPDALGQVGMVAAQAGEGVVLGVRALFMFAFTNLIRLRLTASAPCRPVRVYANGTS